MKAKTMTLMTDAELDERYTPEAALKLSIEKWERAIRKENWETLTGDAWLDYLEARTCALCRKYRRVTISSCGDDDDHCPLAEKDDYGGAWFGCRYGSPWGRAADMAYGENRWGFLKAANELLGILREAQADPEESTPNSRRRCPKRHRHALHIQHQGATYLWCMDCGALGSKEAKGPGKWLYPDGRENVEKKMVT